MYPTHQLTQHHLLILAGGKGERLWPLSTAENPKQFLILDEGKSLFINTVQRHLGLVDTVSILTLERYFFTALDQLQTFEKTGANFFLEPQPKGTLPILLIALLSLPLEDYFFMTPSDLFIKDSHGYQEFLKKLFQSSSKTSICLIGKKPHVPHPGFGYIRHLEGKVQSFIEKPDVETAKTLIASQTVLWNCGMIYANVGTFLNLAKEKAPKTLKICQQLYENKKKQDLKGVYRFDQPTYLELEALSIDRALLEKAENLVVQEAFFDWKDLGSIPAVTSTYQTKNNVTCLNSTNIQVQGNVKEVIIQNLDGITIFENEKQIFILKS